MTQSRILQKINSAIVITIATGALFGVLLLRFTHTHQSTISAGDKVLNVTVADTPELRTQGLSGTESLTPGTGKVFIFDKPDTYGFWMKDMRYPIDIIWIDSDWNVVGIAQNVTPDTYPTVFYPPYPVSYVLEINADEAAVDNLITGTQLQFHK